MRLTTSLGILIGGVVLGLIAYFFLAAPLGSPMDEGFSNPKILYAATIFVIAVITVFSSALVYEILPSRRDD